MKKAYTNPLKVDSDDNGITDDKEDKDENGLTNKQEQDHGVNLNI